MCFVSPRRFTSTTLRTRTSWKVGMIQRVKLVSDFEEKNSWYSYWDKSKNKIPCTRFLSFTFDLFQMDKDEKGKQAGWSNPNYEVTEGKLTRKFFSSLFARLCVVYLFFQSSARLLVKGVLYTTGRHLSLFQRTY